MEIVFADLTLALLEGDDAGQTRLPVTVIKSARRKLLVLRAAVDGRSLQNWKSLHCGKPKGDREGQRFIGLNDQFRMVFTLSESEPLTATILSIGDHH